MGEAVGWVAGSTSLPLMPLVASFHRSDSPPAVEVRASTVAAIASGLSSAFPVASGLSAGAGLSAAAQPPAWAQAAAGTPAADVGPPGVGELVGVFCVGVVDVDGGGVLVGVVVGEGLPDDDGVVVGDGLPDGDVVGEPDGVGEQLGVVAPVEPPPPLLPWPDGVVPPPVVPV